MQGGGGTGATGWTGFRGQIGFTGRRGWSAISIISTFQRLLKTRSIKAVKIVKPVECFTLRLLNLRLSAMHIPKYLMKIAVCDLFHICHFVFYLQSVSHNQN